MLLDLRETAHPGQVTVTIETVEVERPRDRAGFWRRAFALLIDFVIVLVPLQFVVAFLFIQTNGAIQGSFGISATQCFQVSPIPEGLQPSPPENSNFAVACRQTIVGFDIARWLTVGKQTQVGATTSGIFRVYPVGADGNLRDNVFSATWIATLALLLYLVLLEKRSGATIGKRIVGVRAGERSRPSVHSLPLKIAAFRTLSKLIGLLPSLAASYIPLFYVSDYASLEAYLQSWTSVVTLVVGAVIGIGWLLWIAFAIAMHRDPPHDWIAGTAVYRS